MKKSLRWVRASSLRAAGLLAGLFLLMVPLAGRAEPATQPAVQILDSTPLSAMVQWQPMAGAEGYQLTLRRTGTRKALEKIDLPVDVTRCPLIVAPATPYEVQLAVRRSGAVHPCPWQPLRTPEPTCREITDPKVLYTGVRPGAHFVNMETIAADSATPLSPWYAKKKYDQTPPPAYEQIKDRLPRPVWEGHEDVIQMYDYAWKTFFKVWLYGPKHPNHRNISNSIGMPTWSSFGSTMIWDSAFMLQFLRYGASAYPSITALDNCYARQHANGFICREADNDNIETYSGNPVNLPLLAWAEWSWYEVTNDRERLSRVLMPLAKQFEWYLLNYRRNDGLYWGTAMGDGMDDSPRNRANAFVSQTACMAWSAELLARIAALQGRPDLARWFQDEGTRTTELVQRFWDPEHRIYNDLTVDRKPITVSAEDGVVKHVFDFWPLLTGTATPERARDLERELADPSSFLRPCGTASLSADSRMYDKETGSYWHGSIWPPTQYMVIKGLERYRDETLAQQLAERYFGAFLAAYQAQGDITEFIAPEKPQMHGCQNFVGWGGLAPIAILFEDIFGIRVNAPDNTVTLRLRRLERHGVENLHFGQRTLSLVCAARPDPAAPCKLTVTSDGPFKLTVLSPSGRKQTRTIEAGTTEWTVAGMEK